MKNKAFTLVEICIVIVIIGLLASMTIPAFTKIRNTGIVRRYEAGEKLTKDEIRIYQELKSDGRLEFYSRKQTPAPVLNDVGLSYGKVTVNNVEFYMVPPDKIGRFETNGINYILIPVK